MVARDLGEETEKEDGMQEMGVAMKKQLEGTLKWWNNVIYLHRAHTYI